MIAQTGLLTYDPPVENEQVNYDTLLNDVRQRQQCLDQLIAAWMSEYRQRGGTIHCGRGCRNCCGLVVNCTVLEAVAIARQLTPVQRTRLTACIPKLRACAEQADSLKEWLSSYRDQAGPCPFLNEDGSCGIYPLRPLSCRAVLATKEPGWCGTDFSTLTAEDKQAFINSLDRSVVAFPTHYAATPQEIGQELEQASLKALEVRYGFSLQGNLPWLVWLVLEHRLEELLPAGATALQQQLGSAGLLNPYLLLLHE